MTMEEIIDEKIDEAFYKGYKCAISEMRVALEEDNKLLEQLKSKQKDNVSIAICDLQIEDNEKKMKYLRELEEIANDHLDKKEGE